MNEHSAVVRGRILQVASGIWWIAMLAYWGLNHTLARNLRLTGTAMAGAPMLVAWALLTALGVAAVIYDVKTVRLASAKPYERALHALRASASILSVFALALAAT